MNGDLWIAAGLALTLTAGAHAETRSAHAPRGVSYDIHAEQFVKANYPCGHWATEGGSLVQGLDWAVNGVVVLENADFGVNWENDGSPYQVSVGEVTNGVFTAYHSETFYPVDVSYVPCFQV